MASMLNDVMTALSLNARHAPSELEEAVRYGRRERANPGRDGKPRHRYIHKGTIFITDESSKHEITSWKMSTFDDSDEQEDFADINTETGKILLSTCERLLKT